MPKCEFYGCPNEQYPNQPKSGIKLCQQHDDEFGAIVKAEDAKGMLRFWIQSRGGAKKAAAEDAPAIAKGVGKLMDRLNNGLLKKGDRVLLLAGHPWVGKTGTFLRWEDTNAGKGARVRLDNGTECFVVNLRQMKVIDVADW